jgi:Family of unknown function (DUF6492)
MNVDIFIRTYHKDLPWLKYCLKSIAKFCSGFNQIHITLPFKDYLEIKRWNLTREQVHQVKESGEGYLAQQVSKLYADLYCKADYILYVDSDCHFTQPAKPEDYFIDGKPVMLITTYEELGDQVPWQRITEKALKMKCPFETMRRLPLIYPRDLLPKFRAYMKAQHGMELEEYVMTQPHREFSEFNALGAWAYEFERDRFHWINTAEAETFPPSRLVQDWSWGGITKEKRLNLEEVTK